MNLFSAATSTSTSSKRSFTLFSPSQNLNKSIFPYKIPCKTHLSFPPCSSHQAPSPLLLDQKQDSPDKDKPNKQEKGNSVKTVLVVRRPVKEASDEDSDDEGSTSSALIDASLNEFAKRMPIFQPERVESGSQDKPLTVNLYLALYRAKILAKNYRYQEAQELLEKYIFNWPEDGMGGRMWHYGRY